MMRLALMMRASILLRLRANMIMERYTLHAAPKTLADTMLLATSYRLAILDPVMDRVWELGNELLGIRQPRDDATAARRSIFSADTVRAMITMEIDQVSEAFAELYRRGAEPSWRTHVLDTLAEYEVASVAKLSSSVALSEAQQEEYMKRWRPELWDGQVRCVCQDCSAWEHVTTVWPTWLASSPRRNTWFKHLMHTVQAMSKIEGDAMAVAVAVADQDERLSPEMLWLTTTCDDDLARSRRAVLNKDLLSACPHFSEFMAAHAAPIRPHIPEENEDNETSMDAHCCSQTGENKT